MAHAHWQGQIERSPPAPAGPQVYPFLETLDVTYSDTHVHTYAYNNTMFAFLPIQLAGFSESGNVVPHVRYYRWDGRTDGRDVDVVIHVVQYVWLILITTSCIMYQCTVRQLDPRNDLKKTEQKRGKAKGQRGQKGDKNGGTGGWRREWRWRASGGQVARREEGGGGTKEGRRGWSGDSELETRRGTGGGGLGVFSPTKPNIPPDPRFQKI